MLYNNNGNRVKIDVKFNSQQNPHIFKDLKEIHEPSQAMPKGWATIEARARIKTK